MSGFTAAELNKHSNDEADAKPVNKYLPLKYCRQSMQSLT